MKIEMIFLIGFFIVVKVMGKILTFYSLVGYIYLFLRSEYRKDSRMN